MKAYKTALIANDIHFPKHNKVAVNCFLKVHQLLKPEILVLNGDILDCGTVSRHDRFSPPKCHWTDSQFLEGMQKEFLAAKSFLDILWKDAPKGQRRIFMLGNHEVWLQDFINESPKSRAIFDIRQNLNLGGYSYEIYKYGDFINLGKLKVCHGLYTGLNHAKKHVDMMGKSVLYGHNHDIQVHSKVTPESDTHMGWSNGCLSDLNPDYLRNKPQNWNHGFAIVYIYPNSDFQVDLKRITHGKVIVHGQVVQG